MAGRKRFGFGRRSFLLIFPCVLWIYYGIDRWTRNFESSGTAPDRTEGAFTIPTSNDAPARNSHPTIFDDVFDTPPSRSIAAVLPVTSSSLPHLSESLSGLSAIPYLNEVHLLCPEKVTDAVRSALQKTLSHAHGFGRTEFFITLWRHGWTEAESTLQVASSILSSSILILSQDALANVDSMSRSILFSQPPPSLPVPLGLRGSEVSCETKYQGFLTARFVLPPLLLPSHLGTTNQSYFDLTSWQELGAHFTQVEGVGGVVPLETLENVGECPRLDVSKKMATLGLKHTSSPPDSSEFNDSLVILVAERGDIPAWSKLACKFKSRGMEVKVIVYVVPSDPLEPSDPVGEGCDIAYTQVHDPQDPALYRLLGRPSGVFLTLTEYRLPPGSPPETNTGVTVIRIPRGDLPHFDWAASLKIQELRSERP